MKRKPKLTLPLKNEFRVLEAFKSIRTVLEEQYQPQRTLNSLQKQIGMHRSTFYDTLERTKNKGYITYQIIGKGKKALDIQVTVLGDKFLLDMLRMHPSLRQVSSTEKFMDLDKQNRLRIIPASVVELDVQLKGTIGRWCCPLHPNAPILYKSIKGKGALTKCQELGCKSVKRWIIQTDRLSNNNTASTLPAYHF